MARKKIQCLRGYVPVTASYTHDLADKMLTAGAKSYTYDAAGRTVGINAPGGTTTLTYDYESRVTAITGPGINETHTYNGLDTRVGTVQGGVSRTFVRDGSYVTDPVLRDGQATYTPGVSERRGGVSTWSHSGLKNADAQTTSVGAIAATRVYDAFGAELSATGTWKGPFGYAGGFGYQEDSSGLKLLGHRYYDPTTGRFLSRDPIKDGRNWYVYSGNQPTTQADPDGLAVVDLGGSWSSTFIGGLDYTLKVRVDTVTWDVAIAQDGGFSFGPQIGSGPGGVVAVKPGTIAANERSGGYSDGLGDMKPDDMNYSLGPLSFSHAVEGGGGSFGSNSDADWDLEKEAKPVLGIAMRWQVFESELNVSTLLRQARQGLSSSHRNFPTCWIGLAISRSTSIPLRESIECGR
ncbi:hypothetical protein CCB81_00015 [Armatimonadetes bacterium Uphvl-Ar2]|nr:hypothetical protein CCB81_00015 [Armatimonadetes bacterium Uphvl-Ar2]